MVEADEAVSLGRFLLIKKNKKTASTWLREDSVLFKPRGIVNLRESKNGACVYMA